MGSISSSRLIFLDNLCRVSIEQPLCAGTNFLMRAKAFMEAGGSPTYTLTEDFALGMEMKKYGWQCRYVQEYLAVGEAPDEIRNCFQQRSRWTKVRAKTSSATSVVIVARSGEVPDLAPCPN